MTTDNKPACSFCGADIHKAQKLIKARKREVYICNDCIAECLGILIELAAPKDTKPFSTRLASALSRLNPFRKKAQA